VSKKLISRRTSTYKNIGIKKWRQLVARSDQSIITNSGIKIPAVFREVFGTFLGLFFPRLSRGTLATKHCVKDRNLSKLHINIQYLPHRKPQSLHYIKTNPVVLMGMTTLFSV